MKRKLFCMAMCICFFWVVPLYGTVITVDDDGAADYSSIKEAVEGGYGAGETRDL